MEMAEVQLESLSTEEIQLLITMVNSETMAIRPMEMVEVQLESLNIEVMGL